MQHQFVAPYTVQLLMRAPRVEDLSHALEYTFVDIPELIDGNHELNQL